MDATQLALNLSSLAALAGVSALGASFVVAQGQAASLGLKPTSAPVAQVALAAQQPQAAAPDGRVVRVVYPSPFATK